jgi:competence ComEA-like helix-hairpin-helix protein
MKNYSTEITLVALTLIFSGIIIAYSVTNHSSAKIEKNKIKYQSPNVESTTIYENSEETNTQVITVSVVEETDENTTTDYSTNYPVNINSATANDLCYKVPGLGEVLASRIVEYREIYGNFSSVDDLLIISGIGEEKLNDLRPYLTV